MSNACGHNLRNLTYDSGIGSGAFARSQDQSPETTILALTPQVNIEEMHHNIHLSELRSQVELRDLVPGVFDESDDEMPNLVGPRGGCGSRQGTQSQVRQVLLCIIFHF